MSLQKIVKTIKNNKSFLLSTHQDVEGDALGSMLAMFCLLRRLRKRVYMYHGQKVPFNYTFLPFSHLIHRMPPHEEFDVGIILDCSDISRLGRSRNAFLKPETLINIDHHTSNTRFADLNLVEPQASSASEIVYKIYKKFFTKIAKQAALCLYTGIFTDTGYFTYSYTDSYVHRVVSELMDYGVSPTKVYHNVYSSFRIQDIAFLGKVISTLSHDRKGRMCWVKTNRWHESVYGDLTEVIFHNLRFIRDAEVFVLFKKVGNNTVRVNFRSRGKVDVNKIAKFFGGGGHRSASGTSIRNSSIAVVERKVISFIKKHT
ncbi:MAG: bifunctional oligoribonuclease/PAP phosphatase NrnA [Candidatus Omnitrophica bacterium]|nr:bifunctional oligoribonuclease/PAP phosphatase NrnA [Candidatus Omnitrophota bacterium]